MYRAVERSLLQEFVKSNLLLSRIALFIGIFAQPVLLILGPLPGHLLYTAPINSIEFYLSVSFIAIFSFLSFKIYNIIIDRKYFDWIVSVAGKKHFYIGYCFGQTTFSLPTIIFLVLGLLKIDSIHLAIPRLIVFLALHQVFYFKAASNRLKNKNRKINYGSFGTLAYQFLFPVIFHFIIYLISFFTLFAAIFIDSKTYKHFIFIITVSFIFVLTYSTFRVIKRQIEKHKDFLWCVDVKLYKICKSSFYFLIVLMIAVPNLTVLYLLDISK